MSTYGGRIGILKIGGRASVQLKLLLRVAGMFGSRSQARHLKVFVPDIWVVAIFVTYRKKVVPESALVT
jgi:hypothetical protein